MIRGVLLLIFKYYNKTAWRMKRLAGCLGTYDSEPVDDRDCRLLFKARSLSPCVRPFLSSSSLYCNTYKRQWLDKVKGVHFLLNKKSKKKSAENFCISNSPVPFLLSWTACFCCFHWWLCRPLPTGSWSQPSFHFLVHSAPSPGIYLPLPTDYSASWNLNKTQNKLPLPH